MRSDFDLQPGLIYLNSGTQSICPRSTNDAVTRYQRDYDLNPTLGLFSAWPRLWASQCALARFLKARSEDLFLRPNVTAAMNQFILGAPLPSGSEILMSDVEYGAVANMCRFRAERDGLTLRSFSLPREAPEVPAAVTRALSSKTKLLVLSHVVSGTGQRLPIEDIARETRSRGILFAVDGAHAAGAFPIDFTSYSDVDFYGGNLHKWMMGPKGTGFGWVHPLHQSTLVPLEAGWTTFETPEPFQGFGNGSRFAARFSLLGCHDFSAYFAISDMLNYWESRGAENIFARLAALQSAVIEAMERETGWPLITPPSRGPLLAFELPERLARQGYGLMQQLYREHRLMVAMAPLRQGFVVRLSPHIYNAEDELARAATILGSLPA